MAAGGNENVVKIIGVICDFVRDAENDYKATRCNIFGLSHEEYTVLSEVAKVSKRLWIQIDVLDNLDEKLKIILTYLSIS